MLIWIRNNWRLGDTPSHAKISVKRTDIIWTDYQDRVFQEIGSITGQTDVTAATPGWFNYRMKALGNVWSNMTEEDKAAVNARKAEVAATGYSEDEKPK